MSLLKQDPFYCEEQVAKALDDKLGIINSNALGVLFRKEKIRTTNHFFTIAGIAKGLQSPKGSR